MIAIGLALIAAAVAADAPAYPTRPDPSVGQCTTAIAIDRGFAPPMLDSERRATCSAVAVPLSDLAHLLNVESYAANLRAHADAEKARAAHELAKAKIATVRARRWAIGSTAAAIVATGTAAALGRVAFRE